MVETASARVRRSFKFLRTPTARQTRSNLAPEVWCSRSPVASVSLNSPCRWLAHQPLNTDATLEVSETLNGRGRTRLGDERFSQSEGAR